MTDSDEFLDAESENNVELKLNSFPSSVLNDFRIEGPNYINKGGIEEFYDVIEDPEASEKDEKNEKILTKSSKLFNPPFSHSKKLKQRLSILEFLEEEPEESVLTEAEEDEQLLKKRETIYEFLASEENKNCTTGTDCDSFAVADGVNVGSGVIDEEDSQSSLSRLQSTLAESSDHEQVRKSILNIPQAAQSHTNPPPLSHKRDSLLRRANPLATFFNETPRDSDDSDSMISELTEAMTVKTDFSDLRLSRNTSFLDSYGADSLKMSKRYKTVPVKTKSKQKSEFSSLFLIQELNQKMSESENELTRSDSAKSNGKDLRDPSKAIFVLKFSPDGQFLAAAGAEGIIKIWSLRSVDTDCSSPHLATIFDPEPVQILKGHTAEILDCAWSTNNFLLSASMDKTVRLWHHTRSDALGIFQHLDYVTSVAFNPRDPRIFLSGSLDCKLRLWSIQDRTILHWNELPPGNFITAVAFTRSGSTVVAGTSGGAALIFDTEGLRYNTQILVRSSRSKTVGKKITSIESVPGQYDNDERIIISSNDSRIRMYSLRDKNVIYKYKGHENDSSQIGASLSTDADFILSGSEDCRVYIWRGDGKFQKKSFFSSFRKDHINSYESFKAHSNPVTAAIIAPNCVTNLLQSLQLRPLNPLHSTEGKIIITADVTGQIKVFENNSKLIEWLK